ncbi:MAG: hypothetical protein IPG06_15040 [Haliea sp.]|nr:hypothetical protein [Haliea sp.]
MQALQRPAELYSQDDDEIDLRHLWHVVRQSWGGILGLCIVVSLLTVLWVMRIDPVYRASTTIMIESQEAKTVSIEEVYGQPPGIREYFLTQFEIIRNRDVAELVADELDLWNNPLFAPPSAAESKPAQRWMFAIGCPVFMPRQPTPTPPPWMTRSAAGPRSSIGS